MPPSIGVQLLLGDEWLLQKCALEWCYRSPSHLKQLILAVRVNIGLLLAKGLQVKHASFLLFVKPVEFGVEDRTNGCQSYKYVACELIGLLRLELTIDAHSQDSYRSQ